MVNEISNRTLAILLVAAIVISLGGTLVSLSRISSIGILGITGFATNWTNATAKVEIISVTWVNFSNDTIDFGTGYVGGGVNCTMNSSGLDSPPVSVSCKDFHGSNGTLVLANIGNNDVYVNLSFGKNRSELLGGTQEGKGIDYRFIVGNDSAAPGCANTTYQIAGYNTVPVYNSTHVLICDNLTATASYNRININISITIPDNSKLGVLSDEITATAESK